VDVNLRRKLRKITAKQPLPMARRNGEAVCCQIPHRKRMRTSPYQLLDRSKKTDSSRSNRNLIRGQAVGEGAQLIWGHYQRCQQFKLHPRGAEGRDKACPGSIAAGLRRSAGCEGAIPKPCIGPHGIEGLKHQQNRVFLVGLRIWEKACAPLGDQQEKRRALSFLLAPPPPVPFSPLR